MKEKGKKTPLANPIFLNRIIASFCFVFFSEFLISIILVVTMLHR